MEDPSSWRSEWVLGRAKVWPFLCMVTSPCFPAVSARHGCFYGPAGVHYTRMAVSGSEPC